MDFRKVGGGNFGIGDKFAGIIFELDWDFI